MTGFAPHPKPPLIFLSDTYRTRPNANLRLDGWHIQDADLDRVADKAAAGCVSLSLARSVAVTETGWFLHLPKFVHLQQVRLAGCPHVTDRVLAVLALSCAESLRQVDLTGCEALTDVGLARFVTACPQLEELVLVQLPGLGDQTMPALGQAQALYRRLKVLDVSLSVYFSNESFFLMLHQGAGILTTLRAHGCGQVTELGLISFHRRRPLATSSVASLELPPATFALASLDLSNTPVHNLALYWVADGCHQLRHLKLEGCDLLDDVGVQYLARGQMRLHSLSLANCRQLTDEGVGALFQGGAPGVTAELHSLDLRGCVLLTDATVQAVGRGCRQLRDVSLQGVAKYTDMGLRALAQGCPDLVSIDLSVETSRTDTSTRSHVTRFTSQGVAFVAAHCPRLSSIKLAGAGQLQDVALLALGMHCPKLHTLVVRACPQLTEAGFTGLAESCQELEHVNVSGCHHLTDAAVTALAGPRLRHLEAAYCARLSDASLACLARQSPELEHLNVQGCQRFTDQGLATFLQLHAQTVGEPSRLKTWVLRDLPLVSGWGLAGRLARCVPVLTTLDLTLTKAPITPAWLKAPSQEWLVEEARQLPYAEKSPRGLLTLVPASEDVRLFNAWLRHHRQELRAALRICDRIERFLHRCRFYRLYRRVCRTILVLQRVYRGHRGRVAFRRHRDEVRRRHRAATQVQRHWRGWSTRRRARLFRRQAQAATHVLQSAARRFLYLRARQRLERAARRWFYLSHLVVRRHEQGIYFDAAHTLQRAWKRFASARKTRAVTLIQRVFRGHVVRHVQLVRLRRAAVRIQRAYRRHCWWRTTLQRVRQEHVQRQARFHRRRFLAATRLQAWCRQRVARAYYVRHRRAALTVQCAVRQLAARQALVRQRWAYHKRRYHAARLIQRSWRRGVRQRQAAVVIQHGWRHYRTFMRWKSVTKNVRVFIPEQAQRHQQFLVWQEAEKVRQVAAAHVIQRAWRATVVWRRAQEKKKRLAQEAHDVKAILQVRHNPFRQALSALAYVAHQVAMRGVPSASLSHHRVTATTDDDPTAIMAVIKGAAKQAEVQELLALTSSTSRRKARPPSPSRNYAKALLEEQVEVALCKHHLPVTMKQTPGIVDLRLTVGTQEQRVLEDKMRRDPSLPCYRRLPVNLGGGAGVPPVYLWYLLGAGMDAFRALELHLVPRTHTVEPDLAAFAARHQALDAVGIASYGHEACALELHGFRAGRTMHDRVFPIDGLAVARSQGDDAQVVLLRQDPRWETVGPSLGAFGLDDLHLWVHRPVVVVASSPTPTPTLDGRLNRLSRDLLKPLPWYQALSEACKARLRDAMVAYALCVDDALQMHDVFQALDCKQAGVVDSLVLYDFLEEPRSVYGDALLARVAPKSDPMERSWVDFAAFVHLVALLALWDAVAAQQFVFGLLDRERCGAVHVDAFSRLLGQLRQSMDVTLAVERMDQLFRVYCDPLYLTMDFDVVRISIDLWGGWVGLGGNAWTHFLFFFQHSFKNALPWGPSCGPWSVSW